MIKFGHFKTEGFIEQQMLGNAGQPFDSSKNMGDAHKFIINNYSQMISGKAVGFNKYAVIDVVGIEGHFTLQSVGKGEFAVYWNFEPDNIFIPLGNALLSLIKRQVP